MKNDHHECEQIGLSTGICFSRIFRSFIFIVDIQFEKQSPYELLYFCCYRTRKIINNSNAIFNLLQREINEFKDELGIETYHL